MESSDARQTNQYGISRRTWLYLTVVIDLADRMVVGWLLSSNMTAQDTVIRAFLNACTFRKPQKDFIFHSDRGVQYACDDFIVELKRFYGKSSMSKRGDCWDNAVAESFFKTIKVEERYNHKFTCYQQVYSIIFQYINGWYNTLRINSTLNGKHLWIYLLRNLFILQRHNLCYCPLRKGSPGHYSII